MAQHAILRFEKHKGNPARPLEAHHERQKEQYASNPDIDTSRSKYNFHIVKPEGRYYHFIQSRIEIRNLHPGEGVEVDFVREEEAERFLIDYPGGKRTGKRQIVYEKGTEKEMERILTALSSAHICPKRVEMRELTLEGLFMEVVGR